MPLAFSLFLIVPRILQRRLRDGQSRIVLATESVLRNECTSERNRTTNSHSREVLLSSHRFSLSNHATQQLEVVDVESWRVGVEEFGLLVERVGERVRCSNGHRDEVAELSIDVWLSGDMVAHCTLG